MLCQLTLRDFVIVDRLELEFSAGFGTLTGETGAGKSILIDALALALGERADAGVVRAGCETAEVVAEFDIDALPEVRQWLKAADFDDDGQLLLRRVVDAGGRSRAWINGSPATVQQLREVGEWLVDIHGQHAHQSLLRTDAQRQLLDQHAGAQAQLAAVGQAWRDWRGLAESLRQASEGAAHLQREREQLEWLVAELDALAFGDEEWTALDAEHRRLSHAAGLIDGAQYALSVLADEDGACERQIDRVVNRLGGLAEYDPALADVAALLGSVQAELSDAVSTLRRYADRVDLDPARLGEVERRMDSVMAMAKKHRVTPPELPGLLRAAQQRLAELDAAADLGALAVRVERAQSAYLEEAKILSDVRRNTASVMSEKVSEVMQQLALSSGRFEVALLPLEAPAVYGAEQVEFRIAGLAGHDAKPLAKVASGGELSRISLAI
ncbi:MAG: DNA repair protein RecN, partial [Azonexus sp.]|nr:DNA repair protein RecN [Azonexus sp.]